MCCHTPAPSQCVCILVLCSPATHGWGLERITLGCYVWDYQHYITSGNQKSKLYWARKVHCKWKTLLLKATGLWVETNQSEKWLAQVQSLPWPKQEKSDFLKTLIASLSHLIALPLCCAGKVCNPADVNCSWLKSYPFLCSFVSVSRLSICPNCNLTIFHWTELELLKAFKQRMCKISLHSAHPKERIWAKKYHSSHRCQSVTETALILRPEKPFSVPWDPREKKTVWGTNKTYLSHTGVYLAEKISAKLLFFRTWKKDNKTQYFMIILTWVFSPRILLFDVAQSMGLLRCHWD